MKKILVVAMLLVALCAVSCKKNCKCTERNTGLTLEEKMKSSECDELQKELKNTGGILGEDWKCETE